MRRVVWSGVVGLAVLGLVGMALPVGRGAALALAEQQGMGVGGPQGTGAVGRQEAPAASRITRIEIERVEAPAFEGRSFGQVGQYEKLVGRAYGEVDPADPRNTGIVNLARAPRNARGLVEYDTDVYILKPVDGARGNGTIFYEVPNRGNKTLRFNADAGRSNDYTRAAEAGDGFVMRQGYTLVWSAWQGDVLPGNDRLTARFPVATNPDGSSIREWIRTEFVLERPDFTLPVSFDRGLRDVHRYPAVEESMPAARLSRRAGPDAPAELIPRDEWAFASCPDGVTMTPSRTDVCLPAGFSTDAIYDLVYEAQDPMVMGLGFVATSDLISFLRYDTSAANPLVERGGVVGRAPIQTAIGFGSSQAGRALKDLIYHGFNQDAAGRRVFDGALPHITGSRRTFTNYAFSMPGRFSTALEGHHFPGDQFPFTYETLTDPMTGQTDGVLARCRAQDACPKLMHWDSGTEPWQARSSLVVTDPLGQSEVPIPDDVRLYYFSGTQHGPVATPARGMCQQLNNPLDYQDTQRALLVALRAWVTTGAEPPPSWFPSLADGTFVPALPQAAQGFPAIPGVRYNGRLNHLFVNDYSEQPARHVPGTEYPVLVPRVDADGNEVAGVRSAQLQAPLGTYSGWNLRAAGYMEDEPCYLNGSYIPFARTADERQAAGDPRPSLEERYGDQAGYVEAIAAATRRLMGEGFLLPEDAERTIAAAQAQDVGLPGGAAPVAVGR